MLVEAPPKFSPRNGTIAVQIPPKMIMTDVQIGTTKRRIVALLFDEVAQPHE
jgi:hypothetical protein